LSQFPNGPLNLRAKLDGAEALHSPEVKSGVLTAAPAAAPQSHDVGGSPVDASRASSVAGVGLARVVYAAKASAGKYRFTSSCGRRQLSVGHNQAECRAQTLAHLQQDERSWVYAAANAARAAASSAVWLDPAAAAAEAGQQQQLQMPGFVQWRQPRALVRPRTRT
jgi:hypothetical protein